MVYTNLIFFALALLVYFTYVPQPKASSLANFLLSFFSLSLSWYLLTWFYFYWLKRKITGKPVENLRIFSLLNNLEVKFTLFALFFYFYLVYGAGLKENIGRVSFLKNSPVLDLFFGILPFFLFLIILWFNSFIIFRLLFPQSLSRKKYILSHIRLNLPILLPVLLISFFQDLLRLIPFGKNLGASGSSSFFDLLWFVPFLIILMIFYPFFLRLIWGAYPLPQGEQRKRLEESCRKVGLKVSEILIWDSFPIRIITAGITGLIGKFRYLFLTPPLLDLLNNEEMEAVIAHEAGHIKKWHMIYYGLFFAGFPLLFSFFSDLLSFGLYGWGDFFDPYLSKLSNGSSVFSFFLLAFFAGFTLGYFRLFFGTLSRNFERQADLFVFEVIGHPFGLISSLEKISRASGHLREQSNWHHFSIGERIKFLQDSIENPWLLPFHYIKVKRIKKAILALVGLLILLITLSNIPPLRTSIELKLLEHQAHRLMARHQIDLALGVSDFFFQKKDYRRAEKMYQLIIQNEPNNAIALNNLAWLYATADDVYFQDKKKALELAKRAASLKPDPSILDTLAEAYFINGNTEAALTTIEAAINLNPENLSYYLSQKQKFLNKKKQQQGNKEGREIN